MFSPHPPTPQLLQKAHGRYDWLAEDSHFYMATDPTPKLLLSFFFI